MELDFVLKAIGIHWRIEQRNNMYLLKMFPVNTVIVSYCCYNKLSPTWWFKTTQTYYLTEVRRRSEIQNGLKRLKSRLWQTCVPSWRPQGATVFHAFPFSRDLPHSLACGPLPSSKCVESFSYVIIPTHYHFPLPLFFFF